MSEKQPVSPRIEALHEGLKTGKSDALELFWRDVAEAGAPLIEAIEGEPQQRLVTFLWRDQGEDTHNMVVCFGPAGYKHPRKNQMSRLLKTHLWYKTYRVRSEIRGESHR
jgi:enterochelin esterase family protein